MPSSRTARPSRSPLPSRSTSRRAPTMSASSPSDTASLPSTTTAPWRPCCSGARPERSASTRGYSSRFGETTDVRRRLGLESWTVAWDRGRVALEFRQCDAGRPPASELIDALLVEYDVIAGRSLHGGPSAEPRDFAPPGGAFLVGYLDDAAACCGGVKDLGDGIAEIKRMYVVPEFRGQGVARALIEALERTARELG